ncbi:MAG: tetratricopeptide repeat protein [Clostridia bacterium]
MDDLARTLIIVGLFVVMCIIYFLYSRFKKPLSDIEIIKGNNLVKEKKYDAAVVRYEKAIKLGKYKKSSKMTALNNICFCYIEQELFDKAEISARECMSLSSTDSMSRLLYGKILYSTKRYDLAVKHYNEFIEKWPKNASAYSMQALCYARLGLATEANISVNEAIKNKYDGAIELRKEVKKILKESKSHIEMHGLAKDDNKTTDEIIIDFDKDND